ncbi:Os07g0442201 [Oryza sativa Japonica Group]|uniref:Os07g0442201 protein n=1 Tax=Oryza sativa subsp. japonica TaxID=39947 RepID=A0A0P0X542_ORYSJ|nr:Os07g0442201 [Oryza sativa Japonica Group]
MEEEAVAAAMRRGGRGGAGGRQERLPPPIHPPSPSPPPAQSCSNCSSRSRPPHLLRCLPTPLSADCKGHDAAAAPAACCSWRTRTLHLLLADAVAAVAAPQGRGRHRSLAQSSPLAACMRSYLHRRDRSSSPFPACLSPELQWQSRASSPSAAPLWADLDAGRSIRRPIMGDARRRRSPMPSDMSSSAHLRRLLPPSLL